MQQEIKKAIEILNKGGIVIFPTDTVFGIGCRIDEEKAIKRLFRIRKRPLNQPPPVLVSSLEMAKEYINIPDDVNNKLINKYWPGALTIILPCKINKVPELIRRNGTLGVRMPKHAKTLNIIKDVGVPILGPSANFHGEKTPYNFKDIDINLIKQVDYVIPGECIVKKPSTVVDCSKKTWKIIREGAVKISNIKYQISKSDEEILIINTSSNKEIVVGLELDGKKFTIRRKIGFNKNQVVLSMIDKLLTKQNIKLEDLTAIKVNVGPGSFTGIRVGVAIANTLAFLLKIPVKGKKAGELVEPIYR